MNKQRSELEKKIVKEIQSLKDGLDTNAVNEAKIKWCEETEANILQAVDSYVGERERLARVAAIELYISTCETQSTNPNWLNLMAFQEGQQKALNEIDGN